VKCDGCGEKGHRKGSWRCALTGTKKRKRTKKSATKPERKMLNLPKRRLSLQQNLQKRRLRRQLTMMMKFSL
jgi:hypothetical protein